MTKVNSNLREANLEFKGTVNAKHLMQVLIEDIGLEKIKCSVIKPLLNVKVAEHNGCHILRPKDIIGFEDPGKPHRTQKADRSDWCHMLGLHG